MDFDDSFSARMKRRFLNRDPGWSARASGPSREITRGTSNADLNRMDLAVRPLQADQRGVVWTDVAASWLVGKDSINISTGPVDEVAIRTALLFADRVDIPTLQALGYPAPSVDLLRPFEIVQSTHLSYDGSFAEGMRRHVYDAFVALERREPGRWTIARGDATLGLPQEQLTDARGFAVTLHDALPTFSREVAFADVLAFKENRQPELLALRTHLDALIYEFVHNGYHDLRDNAVFKRFDRSLADHMRVMSESNAAKVLTSFRASLSWDAAIPAAIEVVAEQTVASSGLIGAAAVVAFNTVRGLKRRTNLNPFEYLTTVSRELY